MTDIDVFLLVHAVLSAPIAIFVVWAIIGRHSQRADFPRIVQSPGSSGLMTHEASKTVGRFREIWPFVIIVFANICINYAILWRYNAPQEHGLPVATLSVFLSGAALSAGGVSEMTVDTILWSPVFLLLLSIYLCSPYLLYCIHRKNAFIALQLLVSLPDIGFPFFLMAIFSSISVPV